MQCRDEREKWLMLIASRIERAREECLLLGPVALKRERKSTVFTSVSSYLDFKLRVGQPCYIDYDGFTFYADFTGRNSLGQLCFKVISQTPAAESIEEATIIPLTEHFLARASEYLERESIDGTLLESFLRLIEGGRTRSWKEHAASISRRDGILLIWGPPGSGKTTYIARRAELRMHAGKRVLVLSSNNMALQAFENACSVPVVHVGWYVPICSDVVLSTFAKLLLADECLAGFFDTVIVDEVSTARIPELMVAALAAKEELILIGDYMQLGIVAEDEVSRTELDMDIFSYLSIPEDASPECDILRILRRQNRMRPAISAFISRNFYHGLLEDGHLEFKRYSGRLKDIFPSAIEAIDISSIWSTPYTTSTSSHINFVSAVITASLAAIWKSESGLKVAIITPYTAQSALIDMLLKELYKVVDIGVSTVHALQGSEADIVIFDSVDSYPFNKPGKLFDEPYDEFPSPLDRFVNVAVSRAKEKFILVSDLEFFSIHSRGSAFDALIKEAGNASGRLDAILKLINSKSVSFGIPGRERSGRYENSWSMRKRIQKEIAECDDSRRFTFYFADRERISDYQRSAVAKIARCGRNVAFVYRSAGRPHFLGSFHLSREWCSRHPDVSHIKLDNHPYLYALSFMEEVRATRRFIWYGILHPSYPKGERSVPIFRIKATAALAKYLKYIR